MEYTGEGIASLSVPERATITNMGAELGATTSIFPSDDITKAFMKVQKREADWVELKADSGATYDELVEIDLSTLEPMIAEPSMPDEVVTIDSIAGKTVNQVLVGSCTNSSYKDISTFAQMLKGKTVHPEVSVGLLPGSKQVIRKLTQTGELDIILSAGVRVLESACGPCIGMGFSPGTKQVSLRTFNRNFVGRSGTKSAEVYLCSPEAACAAALTGKISNPMELGLETPSFDVNTPFTIDDSLILEPSTNPASVEIKRGPNIQPLPINEGISDRVDASVILKLEDDITTDHIMPAGAKILPLRSNVPAISNHVFEVVDPTFPERAKAAGTGVIVGGDNYGQGSSREHAALAPMYLGIRVVLVKSFARIHLANLINFGILPLTFENVSDYDSIDQDDKLEVSLEGIETGKISVSNKTKGDSFTAEHSLSPREIEIVTAGGALSFVKKRMG